MKTRAERAYSSRAITQVTARAREAGFAYCADVNIQRLLRIACRGNHKISLKIPR
ncbi:MAG: hypothetical protein FWH17_01000 [Oscillospiraceae bacterium]|nr:hypothetical protein [Oscillospiraceae bacterium]